MDDVRGRMAKVWIRAEAGPRRHVVVQVYDQTRQPVAPEQRVRTRHDLIEIADRYGVPLDRVEFLGESARIIEENSTRRPPDSGQQPSGQ